MTRALLTSCNTRIPSPVLTLRWLLTVWTIIISWSSKQDRGHMIHTETNYKGKLGDTLIVGWSCFQTRMVWNVLLLTIPLWWYHGSVNVESRERTASGLNTKYNVHINMCNISFNQTVCFLSRTVLPFFSWHNLNSVLLIHNNSSATLREGKHINYFGVLQVDIWKASV